jgi:hypothetical protein
MKTKTLASKHSMNRSSCQLAFLVIPLALACFAFLPQAWAACQDACLANFNTVQGDNALLNLTTGFSNTAFGANALLSVSTANGNTAVGVNALYQDTTGYVNTAVGILALRGNTTGFANTAVGAGALQENEIGVQNTATGSSALLYNEIGLNNTANGYAALRQNTIGINNTAVGSSAMGGDADILTTGSNNTALGYFALNEDTTGFNNTAMGTNALTGNTSGSNNIALGYSAGVNLRTGSNNIYIGNVGGSGGDSGFIRIGTIGTHTATFVAGIRETPIAGAIPVGINANGQLGIRGSSARFKKDIKPMDKASEAILALQPVTFRYKKELDPDSIPQFGLVAEDVEKVNPDLVARDDQGKPYTVRYEAVNAMLLNEFLKEHQKVQRLEAALAAINEQLKAQDAKIDKVNAKVELTKPAPQMVVNDQ